MSNLTPFVKRFFKTLRLEQDTHEGHNYQAFLKAYGIEPLSQEKTPAE